MKNAVLGMAVAFTLHSCSGTDKEAEDLAAKHEQEYLDEIREKDSMIQVNFNSMDEIEQEINKVKQQHNIATLSTTDAELTSSRKEKIISDITTMSSLLEENRKQIADYKASMGRYKGKQKEFEKKIADMEAQLTEREASINGLKELIAQMDADINRLNGRVDSLSTENVAKADVIKQKDEQIQTAYVIQGTKKELKEDGIIVSKGGVLGVGRTSAINPGVDQSKLTKVNIYQTRSIPVNSKNAKLISSHPSNSYELRKEGDEIASIEILNPDQFWSNSKYLVVQK
jgi:DNA repair exonuclease SbcCD ATPase subunit